MKKRPQKLPLGQYTVIFNADSCPSGSAPEGTCCFEDVDGEWIERENTCIDGYECQPPDYFGIKPLYRSQFIRVPCLLAGSDAE